MFYLSLFCFGIIFAAMLVLLLCLIYAGISDICGALTTEESDYLWETMKACGFGGIAAICLLTLSWLIYGVVLILLTF